MSGAFSISPELINLQSDATGQEINPELITLGPMDLITGEKLLIDFSGVFPEGFVRKKNEDPEGESAQTIIEESPDERMVKTLFTEKSVDARYGGAVPGKFQERYERLKSAVAQLKASPETAEKAQAVSQLIKRYAGDEEEEEHLASAEEVEYIGLLYDHVVHPYMVKIGSKEADLAMARAEISKMRERKWSAEPEMVKKQEHTPKTAVVTIRNSLSGSGDVPHEKVLDYYDSKIRRYS